MSDTSLDRARINVLLLEGVHPNAEATFRGAGYTSVRTLPTALDDAALREAVADAHLIGIRSRTQLRPEILDAGERLFAIGCFCIGTNQVDLDHARRRGTPVFNAPFSNTRSVAELVLAEAILLLRGIPAKDAALKQGAWLKSASNSFEIRGKTLGVVGYGNIGAQLGVLAESMGMRVVFHDVTPKLKLGNAEQVDRLHDLLATSDVVSLHVPQTSETASLIGPSELAAMKPSAVLINASRGNVVDLDALGEALRQDRLLGAAVDVYPTEPASNDPEAGFRTPLHDCPNVILTPHIGGSTQEAQANIAVEVASKLIRYSDTGSTESAVNFPEVSLPEQGGKHRLLNIHRNEPGVMSAINAALSADNVNIAAQYLQTSADVGYVVMDLDARHSIPAMERLREIPQSIRTRVLF